MRTFFTYLLVFCLTSACRAQGRVIVQISNFKSNLGTCRACLFDNAASFNGEGGRPFQCVETTIRNKAVEAVFEKVPAGSFALFVLHDANNNNKMDKNFLGIPKEGYGASRNRLPFAAAPTFQDNKFVVVNGQTTRLVIRLRNL